MIRIKIYFNVYYDEAGEILEYRVVQFDKINSNFQAQLIEHNGKIKVK